MILNFSSFVELFAAIYVTMAVNNDFCSNFWTPRYYKEMELLLKTYDFSGSSSIHDKLMDEIKVKYEVVQNRAHFRGFILLTLCVCYLVFMGYENESNSQIVGHYVPLLYSTIIVGFTILFSGVLLTNWRRTIFAVLVYTLVYVILKIGNWEVLSNHPISMLLYTYKTQLLIGIILLPIIYQMYVYWLHSSIYKGYLRHNVAFEYERFKKSMSGIKDRDKTKVDKIYMDVWTETAFASSGDPTLTSFYKVLNQRLLLIASPSYRDLLFSWIKFHFNKLWQRVKRTEAKTTVVKASCNDDIQQNLSIQNESNTKPVLDFTNEYQQYCTWKKTTGKNGNIKAFCMAKGISYKDMTAWLRVTKPEKTK